MITTPPPPETSLPDQAKDWVREQGRAHQKTADLAAKVGSATMSGHRQSAVTRHYLRNPDAHLSAAIKALKRTSPSRQEVMCLAEQVNPWEPSTEPVRWERTPKEKGGYRIICKLPPVLKANQYLLKPVIDQLFLRNEHVFGVKHFGRDDLAKVAKQLQNEGYVFAALLDVVDCFQSVNPDALYELPLPKEVIRQTLDLREMLTVEYRGDRVSAHALCIHGTPVARQSASGPRGLMQGSPLSGSILAWLLNEVPTEDDVRVFICFDNLIVLAKTPEGTRMMAQTLIAYFQRCSAGPLALCKPDYFDNEPFDFMGYRFDPADPEIGISESGHVRIMACLAEAERVQEQMFMRIWQDHQSSAINRSPLMPIDPLLGKPPTSLWRALRDIRSGYSKVPSSSPEWAYYLDASRWLAERSKTSEIIRLHDNQFAEKGTPDYTKFRMMLRVGEQEEARK